MDTKNLKLIGKGLFSKVWRLNETQVLIKSVCQVKECLSMEWHDSKNVFPEIKRIEDQTYVMEYYPKVTSIKDSLCADHYEVYKQLRKLSVGYVKNSNDLYSEWYKQFETVTDEDFKFALIDMLDTLTNYGSDIQFEISPRNITVKDGKLILLDVFFIQSKCVAQRNSKKRYQFNY